MGGLDGDTSFLNALSIMDLKRDYEFETKRCCTLDLYANILGEYYKNCRIPRGMRLQARPKFLVDDEDFRNKHMQILNKCGMDLLLLHIGRLYSEIIKMRGKMKIPEDKRRERI